MGTTLDRKTVSELTKPAIYFDDTLKGFGIRVRTGADGKLLKSWIVQYRVGKQQRRQKIGDAAKLNADQARKRATEMLAKVTLGTDPAAEKRAARAPTTLTLRAALEKYIEMKDDEVRQGLYRPSSLKITKLYLLGEQYFGPLHRLSINAVTKQAVAARLHEIRHTSSDATAGRARAQLAAAFTRLMQEGLCEQNPTIGTKAQQERPESDRVLNDGELAAVWKACGDDEFGRIVKLLILTGCRRQEIGGLRWSEINLEQCVITIPKERTKNGRALTLTPPKMTMDIIGSIPQRASRDHLFGERADDGFTIWQKCRLGVALSKPWRLHDIRRSVATGMADLGIHPHVIENVLNHASGHKAGIAGIYNRSVGAREMKNALAVWSEHIASIATGSVPKVVQIPTLQHA